MRRMRRMRHKVSTARSNLAVHHTPAAYTRQPYTFFYLRPYILKIKIRTFVTDNYNNKHHSYEIKKHYRRICIADDTRRISPVRP